MSLFLVCYGGVNYATLMPLYNKQSGGRKQGCDSCVVASTSLQYSLQRCIILSSDSGSRNIFT